MSRLDVRGANQLWSGDQRGAQRAGCAEPIERMNAGARLPMGSHCGDHSCQCFHLRAIAVQQLKGFAVVGAHTDIEPDVAGVRVRDNPTHFEAFDLAGQHPVLDNRHCARRDDEGCKLTVLVGKLKRCGQLVGERFDQRATVHQPHVHRKPKGCRPASQQAGGLSGQ